ncbi:hypothetical protein ACOZ38_19825 [Sphaerisporangium viridialbum]|uniref:hypothetical protein n=1 Tax=Sphaerisporangium viridialbum TaxID=46189 RepID=UPI003C76557A
MNDIEPQEEVAGVKDTRAAILKRAGRTAAPLRRAFVQVPRTLVTDPHQDRSGPLAWFVHTKNHRALQSYLMILAATSNGDGPDGWSTTHPIRVWARAFGTTETAAPTSASNAVSKLLQKLEEQKLIERHRRGRSRNIQVILKREDGLGDPYTRPDGKHAADRFLKLPHVFWLDGWIDKLKLPGLAMLLVALCEKHGFQLPTEKMPTWYGWSADTAERGLGELEDVGILGKIRNRRVEPLSASGYGIVNTYYLQPPFGIPAPPLEEGKSSNPAHTPMSAILEEQSS